MPKGKREKRQSQRQAFRLECLENRVALSTSTLFGGGSLLDLAVGDTVQQVLQYIKILSWYPSPGDGGNQGVMSNPGSAATHPASSDHSTQHHTGHHHSQGNGSAASDSSQSGTDTSANSKSSTAVSGSTQDTATKTTATNGNQGNKNNTTGSVVTTSSATVTTVTTTNKSGVSATTYDTRVEAGSGQGEGPFVADGKSDSHAGGGPTDRGGSAATGQTSGSSRTTPDSPESFDSPAAAAGKSVVPYLSTQAGDGSKNNSDPAAAAHQPGLPGTVDPGASGRGDVIQLDSRKNADFTTFGRSAKWVEENVVRATPVTPHTTTGNTTSGQQAEDEDAAAVETNVARDVLFRVLPAGAGQLLDQLPIDAQVVDQAMQKFLHELDDLGGQLGQTTKGVSLLGWAALGVVATTTIGSARRRRRKKRHTLQATGLSNDSLSWMTDLGPSG